jgi:hypothetical protein
VQIARCVFMRDSRAKKGMDEAKAALQKATAVAGADNTTLERIAKGIEQYEKGGGKEQVEIEIVDANEQTRILASNAGTAAKIRAVNNLKTLGREGAPLIAAYCNPIRQDDVEVSLHGIKVLDSMKGNACGSQTLREIKLWAFMEMPVPSPDAKRSEVEREMKLGDSIRAAKQLYNKLQGICK